MVLAPWHKRKWCPETQFEEKGSSKKACLLVNFYCTTLLMMQVFIVFFVVITAVGWWLIYYENIYGSDINCWLIETILIFLSNYQTTAVDKKQNRPIKKGHNRILLKKFYDFRVFSVKVFKQSIMWKILSARSLKIMNISENIRWECINQICLKKFIMFVTVVKLAYPRTSPPPPTRYIHTLCG